jgi:very-short-patch-repair endonuclease
MSTPEALWTTVIGPPPGATLVGMDEPLRAEVRACARRQHGAFTHRQALSAYTPEEIRARLASGRWLRVLRGTYVTRRVPLDTVTRLAAAHLLLGAVTGCLGTAAELHGFGVVTDGLLHVTRPAGCSGRGPAGVRVHFLGLSPRDVVVLDRLRVTSAARTAADLARLLPRSDALATVDAALGRGVTDVRGIRAVLDHAGRVPGVRSANVLLDLADAGAESPMESRLRLRILDAGLPRPVTQYVVGPYRLDLAWPAVRIAAEYDGAVHDGRAATRADRARHNWLRAHGWQVFVFTDVDVYRCPERIGALLGPALGAA